MIVAPYALMAAKNVGWRIGHGFINGFKSVFVALGDAFPNHIAGWYSAFFLVGWLVAILVLGAVVGLVLSRRFA
jgi:hypothetical protein